MKKNLENKIVDFIGKVNKEENWSLSETEIQQLKEKVLPYIAKALRDMDEEKHDFIIKKIIINYYQDGPTVEYLRCKNVPLSQNDLRKRFQDLQNYIKNIIQKHACQKNGKRLSKENIEDIVQDCWEDVIKSLKSFLFKSKLTTWINPVVRNRVIQKWRWETAKKRGGKTDPISIDQKIGDTETTILELTPSSLPAYEGDSRLFELVSREIDRVCKTGMRTSDKIPVDIKILIGVKRFIENKPNKEIAKELNRNYYTVTTVINRIKKLLQQSPKLKKAWNDYK